MTFLEIGKISYIWVQQSRFSASKQRTPIQISDVDLDPESARCENVQFRQFIESVMRLMYLSLDMVNMFAASSVPENNARPFKSTVFN